MHTTETDSPFSAVLQSGLQQLAREEKAPSQEYTASPTAERGPHSLCPCALYHIQKHAGQMRAGQLALPGAWPPLKLLA